MMASQLRAARALARFTPDAGKHRHARRDPTGRFVVVGTTFLAVTFGLAVALTGASALYLCLAFIGCIFILRDFRVGVVLLILLLPVSRSTVFPHAMLGITGLNPLNLLLAGTLGAWLVSAFWQKPERFVPRPLMWLYIVPILLAGLAGVPHVAEIPSAYRIYELIEFDNAAGYLRDLVFKPLCLVLFALLVAAAVRRTQKPHLYLVAALVSVWIMCALVLVFVATSGASVGELSSSTSRSFLSPLGLHANELGRLYAVAYALILFTLVATPSGTLRMILAASLVAVFAALVLTFSRGAFLGFVLVNLMFLFWHRNFRTLLLLAAVAVLAFLLLPDAVYERIMAGHGAGANEVSAGRIDMIWRPLLPEIFQHALIGNGLGAMMWSEAIRRGAQVSILLVTHPHNAYLQALLDVGVVGLAAFCAYYVHVFRGFRSLASDDTLAPELRGFYRGAVAALLSFLIAAATDSSLMPVPEQAFLWLAIGMMYGQSPAFATRRVEAPATGRVAAAAPR
jgi:hypothetical protein